MTEPQVWTLIGVFTAAMFGMMTLMSTMFVRVIRSEIGGLRAELFGEMHGMRAELKSEIASVRSELKSDIGQLSTKIDSLDRDVQVLMKHTFGIDRA